jgi:TldD protein
MTGPAAIDPRLADRLLATALAGGGDHAELFFEYRRSLHLALDDGRIRSVGAGVDVGVGIRVMAGGAVGLAYAESLEPAAMLAAARTAGKVARARGVALAARSRRTSLRGPVQRAHLPGDAASTRPRAPAPRSCAASTARPASPARRSSASRPRSPRSTARSSWSPAAARCSTTSSRSCASTPSRSPSGAVAARPACAAGGGRVGLEYFTRRSPESHAEEAARIALVNLDARPAPAGQLPVVLAAGDAGIWLHEAVGHGLEADFLRKGTSSYAGRAGERVASTSSR